MKQIITSRPVMVVDSEGLKRIDLSDIVYFKADAMYCHAIMRNGTKSPILSCPLARVEGSLPKEVFIRISRSHIINIWEVKNIFDKAIIMSNGENITATKKYINELLAAFLILGKRF